MEPLTVAQAQWLWNQRANTSPTPGGNPAINDWLFEILTEQGFDVKDDVVTKLG